MKVRSGAMRYRTLRERFWRSCLRSDLKDESEGGSGPGGVQDTCKALAAQLGGRRVCSKGMLEAGAEPFPSLWISGLSLTLSSQESTAGSHTDT